MEGFDAPGLDAPALLPSGFNAVQTVVVFRVASAGYATGLTDDPASTVYEPRLRGDIEISQTAWDALGIGGRIGLTLSGFDLWDADRHLAGMIADGTADGRRAVLRTVPVTDPQASNFGTSLGSADVVFRGVVRGVEHTAEQYAAVSLTDIAERLATPLQTDRFLGTGGLEGPSTLAGRPKPVCMGAPYNFTPIPLGNIDLGDGALPTYAVHFRAVESIDAVRIRGVEQAAVVGTAPGVGEFRAWEDDGVFQIGSDADGVVTCDASGDNIGGYASTTGAIIRRLITDMGPGFSADDIQDDSFLFADIDLPGEIGWYKAEETTAVAAVDEILAGSGAALCGGRGGTIRLFDPLAGDAAQWSLPTAWILAVEPIPLPAALRPLPRQVGVDWGRNWTPLSDIAGVVPDTARARLSGQASGPARASDDGITLRVLQQRDMRLPGLYAAEADALLRAERWRDFLAASPRGFRITTDRYLGEIECGDLGVFQYPAFGLADGAAGVVVGWRQSLSARRLTVDVVTVPWIDPQPDGTGRWDVDFVFDVTRWA